MDIIVKQVNNRPMMFTITGYFDIKKSNNTPEEIVNWCYECFDDRNFEQWSTTNYGSEYWYTIRFNDDESAMAFKLRWL